MLRFDSLSTPRTCPAYHHLGAVGGAPVSADVKGLGQMSGVLLETKDHENPVSPRSFSPRALFVPPL